MNKIVKLLPKTKRLKQVIKEFGDTFKVIKIGKPPCFDSQDGVKIISMCGKHIRWVKPEYLEG